MPNAHIVRPVHIADGKRASMALHADSQCPTCSSWLHENEYASEDVETVLHSHSEDEVMFVTAGTMRVGNRYFGPGTALAVRANVKYGFFSGPGGLSFVNFRNAAPTYRTADGSVMLDEAELWRNLCGEPRYRTLGPE
jgi:hypothetical protein